MAFIMDIRQKFGPIIVIIIGLSLAIFVLQTALESNTSLLGGSKDVVGVVDGDKIRYNEYMTVIAGEEEAYNFNPQAQPITDNIRYSLREQAWTKIINDRINGEISEKMGITVTSTEMQELFFGSDPHPGIKSSFTNRQTGVFDPSMVKQYIASLDKSIQGEDPVRKRAEWLNFERQVRNDRMQTKIRTLFHAGVYIPKWLAEVAYTERNTKYNVDYVAIPYTYISDSAVKVTDEDLQKYIDENAERFKQEESRKVEFVTFTVNPTREDSMIAYDYIKEAADKLLAAELDTTYVKMNADRSLDNFYYSVDNIPDQGLKDTLLKVEPGTVVGPMYSKGMYYVAKVIARANVPDSVKASHILFAKQGEGVDSVKSKMQADSVFNAIKGGASFEELAKKYSADKASGEKGGDLGFIKQGQTVKNFNEFLFFGGQVGEVRLINTEFGYHVVKIMEGPMPEPAVKYYVFSRLVEASSKTDKEVYGRANQFLSKNSTGEAFSAAMKSNDKSYASQTAESVKKSDFQLAGLENARELVAWSYRSEPGAVSPVFQSGNLYVIGHLVEARPKGTQSVATLRPQIEGVVRNKKKGEKLAAEVAASSSMNATLESIAAKYNTDVKNAPDINIGDGYVPGIGSDPAFLGKLSTMKEGQVSKPIIGNNNLIIVRVNSIAKAQPIADYTPLKDDILRNTQPRIEYGITEALKKKMDIEDLRYNFF